MLKKLLGTSYLIGIVYIHAINSDLCYGIVSYLHTQNQ